MKRCKKIHLRLLVSGNDRCFRNISIAMAYKRYIFDHGIGARLGHK